MAILPDLIGACSIEDGAGFLRNQISYEDIKSQLRAILQATLNTTEYLWVVDVFKKNFIFENGSRLYKQDYTIIKDKVSISGLPVEVIRRYEYVVINNKRQIKTVYYDERINMTDAEKKTIVDNLINQKSGLWAEKDREFLMSHNEEDLKHIADMKIKTPVEPIKKVEPEVAPIADNKGKKVSNIEPKTMTVEEFIANAPKDMQDVLRHGQETYNKVRAGMIAVIVANEDNIHTEDQLNLKSIDDLRGLVALCKTEENEVFDYSGQGSVAANDDEQVVLPLPVIDWTEN